MYQLHLLDALLSLPNDTFNLVSLPGRRIVTVDDVGNASPTIKSLAANVQGHTWNSLDLIETLCRIGDVENLDVRQRVREMLDKAVKISAELVHMGLLQVPVSRYKLQITGILTSAFQETLGSNSRGIFQKTAWNVPRWAPKSPASLYADLADQQRVPHFGFSRLLR
jgi:hypothetical protein